MNPCELLAASVRDGYLQPMATHFTLNSSSL